MVIYNRSDRSRPILRQVRTLSTRLSFKRRSRFPNRLVGATVKLDVSDRSAETCGTSRVRLDKPDETGSMSEKRPRACRISIERA